MDSWGFAEKNPQDVDATYHLRRTLKADAWGLKGDRAAYRDTMAKIKAIDDMLKQERPKEEREREDDVYRSSPDRGASRNMKELVPRGDGRRRGMEEVGRVTSIRAEDGRERERKDDQWYKAGHRSNGEWEARGMVEDMNRGRNDRTAGGERDKREKTRDYHVNGNRYDRRERPRSRSRSRSRTRSRSRSRDYRY